jgi:hypothetical protein
MSDVTLAATNRGFSTKMRTAGYSPAMRSERSERLRNSDSLSLRDAHIRSTFSNEGVLAVITMEAIA